MFSFIFRNLHQCNILYFINFCLWPKLVDSVTIITIEMLLFIITFLQSRGSSGGDYGSSSGSSGFGGSDNLSSAYQRDSSPSRLSYPDVKSQYLHHDSGAGSNKLSPRSSYYGGGGSSSYSAGDGYDSSYKPRDSLYPGGGAPSGGKPYQ